MYEDKLDGRIDMAFFDRKASEWRAEQNQLLRAIEEHQQANQSYLNEGVRLLELARRAPELFEKQEPSEKRRLLNFVLSNCTWKEGNLSVIYRQPFDLLALANGNHREGEDHSAPSGSHFGNWLGGRDSNPDKQIQSLLSYR